MESYSTRVPFEAGDAHAYAAPQRRNFWSNICERSVSRWVNRERTAGCRTKWQRWAGKGGEARSPRPGLAPARARSTRCPRSHAAPAHCGEAGGSRLCRSRLSPSHGGTSPKQGGAGAAGDGVAAERPSAAAEPAALLQDSGIAYGVGSKDKGSCVCWVSLP